MATLAALEAAVLKAKAAWRKAPWNEELQHAYDYAGRDYRDAMCLERVGPQGEGGWTCSKPKGHSGRHGKP